MLYFCRWHLFRTSQNSEIQAIKNYTHHISVAEFFFYSTRYIYFFCVRLLLSVSCGFSCSAINVVMKLMTFNDGYNDETVLFMT